MPPAPSTDRSSLFSAVCLGLTSPLALTGPGGFGAAFGLGLVSALASADVRRRAAAIYAELPRDPRVQLVAIAVVAGLVSAAVSPYPGRAATTVLRTAAFGLTAPVLIAVLSTHRDVLIAGWRSMVAGLLVAVAVAEVGLLVEPAVLSLVRLSGWDPDYYVITIKGAMSAFALAVPFLIYGAIRLRGPWRWMAALAALVVLVLVVQMEARAPVAGLLGGAGFAVVAVAFGLRRPLVRVAVIGGFAAAIAAVLSWLMWFFQDHLPADVELFLPAWLIDPHRQAIWRFSADVFQQQPWLGMGANNSNYAAGADVLLPGSETQLYMPAHPHNAVLELLVDTGVIATLPLLFATALALVALLVRAWRAPSAGNVLLGSVACVFLASAMFNFSIWTAWWQLAGLTMISFAAAAARVADGPRPPG